MNLTALENLVNFKAVAEALHAYSFVSLQTENFEYGVE